jgi:hypothetical protein
MELGWRVLKDPSLLIHSAQFLHVENNRCYWLIAKWKQIDVLC